MVSFLFQSSKQLFKSTYCGGTIPFCSSLRYIEAFLLNISGNRELWVVTEALLWNRRQMTISCDTVHLAGNKDIE